MGLRFNILIGLLAISAVILINSEPVKSEEDFEDEEAFEHEEERSDEEGNEDQEEEDDEGLETERQGGRRRRRGGRRGGRRRGGLFGRNSAFLLRRMGQLASSRICGFFDPTNAATDTGSECLNDLGSANLSSSLQPFLVANQTFDICGCCRLRGRARCVFFRGVASNVLVPRNVTRVL